MTGEQGLGVSQTKLLLLICRAVQFHLLKNIKEEVFRNFEMSVSYLRSILAPLRMLSDLVNGAVFDRLVVADISPKWNKTFKHLYLVGSVI